MKARDIAVCIVTVDRSPGENYLDKTLNNLVRAGALGENVLHSAHVFDSGPVNYPHDWPERGIWAHCQESYTYPSESYACVPFKVHSSEARISGKQNCARALIAGAETGAPWVLHLEDDLDVCDDFINSVGRWLGDNEYPKAPIYSFAGNHASIACAVKKGHTFWDQPVEYFWGNQCLAMRPAVALDIGRWLQEHPIYTHADGRPDENAHDLELMRWAAARGHRYFRQSAPSFVQHIGAVTSVPGNAMGGKLVTFPSWPGPHWSYR